MGKKPVSDEVRRFLLGNVPSIPHLEAILLLRNKSAQVWDAVEVAKRLYIPEKKALAILAELVASGIFELRKQGNAKKYCYQPASNEIRETVDETALAYASNLVEITDLIHSRTSKKAQQFADAFKWREE